MPRPSSFACPGLNVDIEKPRYDQSTYWGRVKHFVIITNPLNLFALPSTLAKAKERVVKYRRGDSNQECLTEDELWRAKQLYDSAFHPDTGEKMILIGRMSAQMPMNTAIRLPPIYGRLVPFVAVVAANFVNLPIMRYEELSNGTPIFDENDKKVGQSRMAAVYGIGLVLISRISMPVPAMGLTPFLMDHLERKGTFQRYPYLPGPIQVASLAIVAIFAVPLCCAFFVQRARIKTSSIEASAKEQVARVYGSSPPEYVYFNKGL
ncbi:sideroflexin [Holotrichia oblita]|uniref:Sideroflexin n=1 Tax=Holotrichia oblita TaxID=644536 RepID=A0ACB9T575_HOLOL|nr:sideroflexin [Holotrichia oblita]